MSQDDPSQSAPPGRPAQQQPDDLALALASSGTGVWDHDIPAGRIVYSSEWKAMLGYGESEIGNRIEDSYSRVHPDDLGALLAALNAHMDKLTPAFVAEHRLCCKDGRYKWVLSRGKVVARDRFGKAVRMTGVTTDISDTVAVSEKVRHSADLLTFLTDEAPGMVYQYRVDRDGAATFPYTSAGIVAMFGATPAQARLDAAAIEACIHPDDLSQYRASLAASRASLERWQLTFRVVLPGQGERWRAAEARPRHHEDGSTTWNGFVTDVTGHKQLEQRLLDTAATDFVTGLANRRHFLTRMGQELARIARDSQARAVVLVFELDRVKGEHSQRANTESDAALKHFSLCLLAELRAVDSAGRIGAVEFAAVLPGAGTDGANVFAQRVRARLAQSPLADGAARIALTVSIGISTLSIADKASANALARADAALRLAKRAGGDRVQISDA